TVAISFNLHRPIDVMKQYCSFLRFNRLLPWVLVCIPLLQGNVFVTSASTPATTTTHHKPPIREEVSTLNDTARYRNDYSITSSSGNPVTTMTSSTTINSNNDKLPDSTTAMSETPIVTTAEDDILRVPDCLSVMLLVELPIGMSIATSNEYSSTHAYVRRCIGVNNENRACVSKDNEVKMEHWKVVRDTKSNKDEIFHVNWVYHDTCDYQRRKCPFDMAQKCHMKRTTHYYDEVNCTCTCIVQIDEMETCLESTNEINFTSGNTIWLPLITFFLGIAVSAIFIYFKTRQSTDVTLNNGFKNSVKGVINNIGPRDVEQPAEHPTPPAAECEDGDKNFGIVH
ncbi:unnamed protein product, partial [Meganyctiphanes norvegica]